MSIKVGDKVTIVDKAAFSPLNGAVAEVLRIYEVNPPVAYVVLESDKAGLKIPLDFLEKVEPESEISEGAKEISRNDFDKALVEVTTKAMSKSGNLAGVMTGVVIGEAIGAEIFKEADVVTMTEDQFIGAMWTMCSPEAVNRIIDNGLPVGKAFGVAIAAIITLRKIPEILFGGSEERV